MQNFRIHKGEIGNGTTAPIDNLTIPQLDVTIVDKGEGNKIPIPKKEYSSNGDIYNFWGGRIEPRINDTMMIASCASRTSSALLGRGFLITIYTYDPDFTGVRVLDLDTGLEVIPAKITMSSTHVQTYFNTGKRGCQLVVNAVRKGNLHYRFHITDSLGRVSKDYKDLTLRVK